MKTCFLDGPSLAGELSRLVERCDRLDIAMAYVKLRGLNTLLRSAGSLLEKKNSLRIVFGLAERFGITDWQAAERLLELSTRHGVLVKKLNMPGFHPKLLIFHGNPSFIVVGSANLTWAAQSKNVEANLLVEDPGEELMKDSREFFEHCFSKAPRLTRRHVERYKKRTAKIAVQPPRERSDEDELPLPPRTKAELESIKRGAAVWKIAPGKDADRWHEWFENIDDDGEGIVAMGWNEVGSLDRFETYEDLKEEVVRTAHNKWDKESERKTKVKYVTDQLWTFGPASRSFREGDVFVVYSECKVQGVAVMTRDSKYQFQTLRDISFAHQINVKYRWYKQRPHRADERVIDALGKQGTLMLIEQPEFLPYLLSTLS